VSPECILTNPPAIAILRLISVSQVPLALLKLIFEVGLNKVFTSPTSNFRCYLGDIRPNHTCLWLVLLPFHSHSCPSPNSDFRLLSIPLAYDLFQTFC